MRDLIDSIAEALAARPNATMAELAQSAGLSRATLHRRFPSREQLLAGIAEQAAVAAERAVTDAQATTGPARDACVRLVTALVPLGARFAFLLREGAWLDERPAVAPGVAAVTSAINDVIHRGRRAAEFRVDMPASFQARLVLAAVLAAWEAVQAGELGRKEAPGATVAALLTGIEASDD